MNSRIEQRREELTQILSEHRWHDYECACQKDLPDNEVVLMDRGDHSRHVASIILQMFGADVA